MYKKGLMTQGLTLSQKSFLEMLDNLFEGLYIVDKDCRLFFWNNSAEHITGYGFNEIRGRVCSDNILAHIDENGNTLCDRRCPLKISMSNGRTYEVETFLKHKDGHRVPVSIRTFPFRKDGVISGAVEVFVDNSAKMVSSHRIEELQRLIMIDHLTGLTNRRFIEMSIDARLGEMKRYGWLFGILFIDIDNFKKINDLYGHATGDKVLKMIAQTVMSNSRPFDTTGRWGGEEFISVILNVDQEKLLDVANRMRILIEQSTMISDSVTLGVTVSIGATMANSEDTVESIIRRADLLMYQGKVSGKNRVIIG